MASHSETKDREDDLMRFLASAGVWLAIGLAAAISGSAAGQADQWTSYRMAEVTFQAPADWKVTRQQRDRAFLLQDPARKLELRAEWWMQDEPILGYDDIRSHKRISVAGKPATYIHSVFPETQTLTAVLDEKRKDGRKLLLVLESSGPDLSVMAPLFEDVLARVSFAGAAAPSPRRPSAAARPVEQKQATGTPVDAAAMGATVLHDAKGQFALRHPADWRKTISARDGVRAVTLSPADRQALLMIAALTPTRERDLAGVVEDFEGIYYDNYLLPDSIEADGDLRIGTLDGRYVEMFGQVHPIEGVRLAFSDGRSWLFKSVGDQRAYIIAYVHARSADATLKAALDTAARSVRVGAEAAELVGEKRPARPAAPAALSPRQTPLSAPMQAVARHFGNDCEAVSLTDWNHPALAELRKRRQAHVEWVMLCRNRSHPVFGVNFDHDPRGRTGDFFTPLYDDMLQASQGDPFSLAVLKDELIIDVARPGKDEISVEFREAPDLPKGADRGKGSAPGIADKDRTHKNVRQP